ncbi:hypothetical protein PS662_05228 [Pseudomonas fluorescens]|uniref:CENP-V/GFA domain-containing protein n=1 Tax=Pseudomonas fluorescens TaxID=294 RepID=A0A5E6X7N8_PSEFL|nr:GFA family protein [Pseudomonas fluorescens]VVN37080.1 hypothetical protein PS662_05228 [Pseudomonas fluorescens]
MAIYACHCRDCQTWSGSSFAMHALMPEDAFTVSGEPVEYAYDEGGQHSVHSLCGVCHTRLYNTTSAAPGMKVLRVGTLDRSPDVTPMAHIWVKHKQPWLLLPAGVPSWPQSPSPEGFAQALSNAG